MSARNTLEAKRARKLSRSITKGVLPGYVDVLAWIKLRANVTTSAAVRVAVKGALKVDSHTIGRTKINGVYVFDRYVPATLVGQAGKDIVVVMPRGD